MNARSQPVDPTDPTGRTAGTGRAEATERTDPTEPAGRAGRAGRATETGRAEAADGTGRTGRTPGTRKVRRPLPRRSSASPGPPASRARLASGAGRAALDAEWIKLRTLPSTWWLLFALAAVTAATGAAMTGAVDTSHCPTPAGCHEDTPRLALSGVRFGQAAAVVLGVLAIGGEYATGTIGPTLTAVPGRVRVLLAKAAVLAAAVAAAGTAGVAASLAAGRFILAGNGFTAAHGYPPLSPADGPTARAAAGTVLYLVLVALLALGAGAALRDTAGAITAVLALLWLTPVLDRLVTDPEWRERLDQAAPMPAGLAVQATRNLETLPIGPWAGLAVFAAYAAAALLAGAVLLTVRDC